MTTQTMAGPNPVGAFKQMTGLFIGSAVLMIVLGLLAISLPLATGIGIALLVAWITIFAGLAHVVYAFAAEGAGPFIWRLLVGIVYVVGGFYLAFNPGLSLVSLTLVLAAIFFAEGFLRIVFFFRARSMPGAGWVLFDGVMTVLLGFLIARNWPDSSAWAIGTIVGVNLCVSGVTRLMFSVAARRAVKAAA